MRVGIMSRVPRQNTASEYTFDPFLHIVVLSKNTKITCVKPPDIQAWLLGKPGKDAPLLMPDIDAFILSIVLL